MKFMKKKKLIIYKQRKPESKNLKQKFKNSKNILLPLLPFPILDKTMAQDYTVKKKKNSKPTKNQF